MDTPDMPVPTKLSNKIGHRDYHPSYLRIGVVFDGEERTDVMHYDVEHGVITTTWGYKLSGKVEPYWRYKETRQQRRARERWEAKHKGQSK